jgi:hypothetical protein
VYAIPPNLQDVHPLVTGVSCPECGGVLQVGTEGRDSTLVFECRIGHTFDVPELLAAKEECLEKLLWGAYTMHEELIQLLDDLTEHAVSHDAPASMVRAFRLRAARAKDLAQALRSLIEDNRPIDLAPADPAKRSGSDSRAEGIEPAGDASSA